jgi:hypothetical protein
MRTMIALLVIAMAELVHAQSSSRIVRNPRNMSSGGMLTMVQEYEDGSLPDDLGIRFDGSLFFVEVAVDTDGFVICEYDPRGDTQMKKELHVSDTLLRRLAAPVCSSIRTWKFRPFLEHGRPFSFHGPLPVKIERQRFVLPDYDPSWRTDPPPVKRN